MPKVRICLVMSQMSEEETLVLAASLFKMPLDHDDPDVETVMGIREKFIWALGGMDFLDIRGKITELRARRKENERETEHRATG